MGKMISQIANCNSYPPAGEIFHICYLCLQVPECQVFTCERPGIYRDPRDCGKFWICGVPGEKSDDESVRKSPEAYDCPEGYFFQRNEGSFGTTCVQATG